MESAGAGSAAAGFAREGRIQAAVSRHASSGFVIAGADTADRNRQVRRRDYVWRGFAHDLSGTVWDRARVDTARGGGYDGIQAAGRREDAGCGVDWKLG